MAENEKAESGDESDEDFTTVNMTLELVGFSCHPSEISNILGLAARRTGTAEEPYVDSLGRPTRKIVKQSFWVMAGKTDCRAPLGDQLANLLAPIRGMHAQFSSLPPMEKRVVRCTVIRGGRVPSFHLPPDLTGELAALGLTLDIDFLHIIGGPSDEELKPMR